MKKFRKLNNPGFAQKHLKLSDLYSIIYFKRSTNRSGFLKNRKFVSNILILFAIVCYVTLLGFSPLLHDHEHAHDHESEQDHEHEHSEPSHSEENCAACAFINTNVEFKIQPAVLVGPSPCCGEPSPSEVVFVPLIPATNIQSRAPPIFPNSI